MEEERKRAGARRLLGQGGPAAAVLKAWRLRQEARALRVWAEKARCGRQREAHVASALALLRDKSLQTALATGQRVGFRARARGFSRWLSAVNLQLQLSLSVSLLRLNLRPKQEQCYVFAQKRVLVAPLAGG